jgi:hypothetical protein
MVQHGGRVGLDGIEVSFDDERAVANAGIAVVATLAQRLGVERVIGVPPLSVDTIRLGGLGFEDAVRETACRGSGLEVGGAEHAD